MVLLAVLAASCARFPGGGAGEEPAVPFTVYHPDGGLVLPAIVVQHDPVAGTGVNWEEVKNPKWHESNPPIIIGRAAHYLQEALRRMTGREFPVVSTTNLSAGIVLTLAANAADEIRQDPEVRAALREDPAQPYAATEAFYLRSETNRVLVVANTADGLAAAVVELLESVDYEVLGMGPNWIHAPDHRGRPLVFAVNRAGRPSFYIRGLHATSGQQRGIGTIATGLTDPADEPVTDSYWRWVLGTRFCGKSMPWFPGHALQGYHQQVIAHMRQTGATEGFLTPRTIIGPATERPAASPENKHWLWIDTEPVPKGVKPYAGSDGETWIAGAVLRNLDLSVPFVREIVFATMTNRAATAFEKEPDAPFVFGMDAEDGAAGNAELDVLMKYPNWYPEYRAREKLPFGRPYVLHGYNGLDHPQETWDPAAASDNMFGFAGWLLHEFDKWIESLPAEQRVTATGRPKKELVRCSFYSYNYHDVPPNFNPDQRIRVMIASYPKHRGRGQWEKFATQEDLARAFQVMLPREPSGDYRILSLAYYKDDGPAGIPARWSAAPAKLVADYRRAYDAGYRAISAEIDLNFGKYGLAYHLISRLLWNIELTAGELDTVRDRWFRRAFGSAWQEMKAYYDLMVIDNYPVNGPNTWGQAIRLIDAADRRIDGSKEPAAQRRIDDVKQYWYCHYLLDSGRYTKDSPELKEYLWKGQMSYMVAMHAVARRVFDARGVNAVNEAVGPALSSGPAHYTHAETQAWWAKVLEYWPVTPVTRFADATLANGQPAKSADLNDLVMVQEFQDGAADVPFYYNSGSQPLVPVLMIARRAGEPLGFKLVWPHKPDSRHYDARRLPYGAEIWDPARQTWEPWIDSTMVAEPSVTATNAKSQPIQVVEVRTAAPRAGTYRFTPGHGGLLALFASLAYDPATDTYADTPGFTFCTEALGLHQSPVYFYIPKGTKRVDLEVWDQSKVKYLYLYRGLPAEKPVLSRKIDVGAMGTHTVAIEPGEDGTVAKLQNYAFTFPYLYSVPTLWAKSPAALLVPRAIAMADGLTILPAE